MLGLMQDWSLTLDRILDHAKAWHGETEIVSRSVEGPVVRTTYAELHDRAKRVSSGLIGLGARLGDRVATLAWNTARHMEIWYGTMGVGMVCHTLNPRLFAEQLAWIINHAEDRILFVDLSFVGLVESVIAQCPTIEHVIVMTDEANMPAFNPAGETGKAFKGVLCYETFVAGSDADIAWGGFDENTAAGLCYTSGTTGDPKGVLYSHRSNFIHCLAGLQRDVFGVSAQDVILPVVPMFHANAWGIAFHAPAAGAKLVMPGQKLDGASVYELLESEGVTFSAAVPTVWQGLLQYLQSNDLKLSTLKRVAIGGSACPESLIRAFHDDFGVDVIHAWGMTEMSPLGTLGSLTRDLAAKPFEEQMPWRMKQGRPPLTVDMKLVDDEGWRLPNDGKTFGRLLVAGPAIVKSYFKGAGGDVLDDEGYFDTGDVATLDGQGYMQITDRAKDVIKSGGEWISSIDLENVAVGHPKAAIAAVIGMPHPKWDERPLLLVKLKPGEEATKQEFIDFFEGKIAKWWTPDDVLFVDDIPLGATGKIDKKLLRKIHEGYVLPTAGAAAPASVALSSERDPVLYAPEPQEAADPGPFDLTAGTPAEEAPAAELVAEQETQATETAALPVETAADAAQVPEPGPSPAPDSEPPLTLGGFGAGAAPAPQAAPAPDAGAENRSPLGKLRLWARRYLNATIAVSLLPAAVSIFGFLAVVVGAWSWSAPPGSLLLEGAVGALGLVPALWQLAFFLGVVGLIVALALGVRKLGPRALLALGITFATLLGFKAASVGALPSVVAADLGAAVIGQLGSAFGL